MIGWIAISRKLLEAPEWTAEPFTRAQAWVDLIGLARYATGEAIINGRRVQLQRGQLAWSSARLAERWKWSPGRVKRFLADLQADQRIDRLGSNVTSVTTITNYDAYQQSGPTDGPTHEPTAQAGDQSTDQPSGQLDSQPADQPVAAGNLLHEGTNEQAGWVVGPTAGPTDGPTHRPTDGPRTNKVTNKQPPPPTPSEYAGGWEEVVGELRGEGIRTADAVAASAREANCSPADVFALVEHFRRHATPAPPAWEAGALAERVRTARPGEDPSRGWYSPNPQHVAAVQAAIARKKRAEKATARNAHSEQAVAQRERLEAVRSTLETLGPDELAALELAALPDANARRIARNAPALREEAMLRYLAKQAPPSRDLVPADSNSDWEDVA